MTRPVDSNGGGGGSKPAPLKGPKPGHTDHLKPLTPGHSQFEKEYSASSVPSMPLKLGSKEYDGALWDSPMLRTLKRAITGWAMPEATRPQPLSRKLADTDPRLTPTITLPGREEWRIQMARLIASGGEKKDKPTAYFLAGAMGVGKMAIAKRFYETGVLPTAVVKADADYLHALIPEQSQLEALGDGRADDVVHEEASTIGREAYSLALAEKRDVVHNSMFDSPRSLGRLQQAKDAGFRRVTLAIASSLDVARERAGGGGRIFDDAFLVSAHQSFANGFDALAKQSDELVLLFNDGKKLSLIAQGKDGELTVKDPRLYAQFQAMKGPVEK